MKTDNDVTLAERFAAITDNTHEGDWDDVLHRRATAPDVSRQRIPRLRLAALLAALLVAVTVALVAPWNSSNGSLSDRALAAIGSQPVLHLIGELPTGAQLVDIETGNAEPIVQREEIWYDQARGLKHTITRSGTAIVDDVLETPRGGYSPSGIVYDCAWIAAHPVQATKVRVSCNESGDNGTKPHNVPRPKPTIEPGLAGFLDGYQQALRSGRARDAGKGQLDGRTVDWLEFTTDRGTERVALDPSTHKPVLIEDDGTGLRLRLDTVETVASGSANFTRPTRNELGPQPTFGGVTNKQALSTDPASIATAIPGAIWSGPKVDGLALAGAHRTLLTTSFAHGTQAPQTGTGLELDYGELKSNGRVNRSLPFVHIAQAPSRALAYGYEWGFVRGDEPPAGKLYEPGGAQTLGFTVNNGRYLTIQASSPELLHAAAQAVQPMPN
jgi:hypothetical protein